MKNLSVILSLLGLLLLGLIIGTKQMQKPQEVRTKAAALPKYNQVSGLEISAQEVLADGPGSNEADIGKWVIPSISGFSSDPFTGTATLSYPIQLPAGIRGLQPSLSLSYSSATIDDSRLQEKTKDWQYGYKSQAGEVGLGWGLGGLGYITKDRSVYPHAYYLVFPGGSAKLLPIDKNNDGWPEEWETNPKIFAKIYHSINNHYNYKDTNHWEIITKDGAHYIFGEQIDDGGKPQSWGDPMSCSPNESPTSMIVINNSANTKSSMEPNKWQLAHIFDASGNQIKFHYQQELRNYSGGHYPFGCYTKAILPSYIEYGHNREKYLYKIEFGYQDNRQDYRVPDWDAAFSQSFWTGKLLKEIRVLSNGQLVRKYVLTYEYTPKVGEYNHSILTKIEHLGRDGQRGLPPFVFTYNSLSNLRGEGYKLGDIYLLTANNGYGGKVVYDYDWFGSVAYFNRNNERRDSDQTTSRARLKQKIIEDGVGNSYLEIYDYANTSPVAYVKEGADALHGTGDYKGFEYLGHSQVEVKLTAKNNPSQTVSRAKSYFHQYLAKDDCFRVDPRKGMAYRSEALSVGGDVLTKTENQNSIEINGRVFENPVCANIPGATIEEERTAQFFVFNRRSDSFITDAPGIQKRTASENLEYDFNYGHLKKSVAYGEADFTSGNDLDPADNKYSFTEYAPANLTAWLVSQPSHTFISDTSEGTIKYKDSYIAYDGKDFGEMPDKGLATSTKVRDDSYSPAFEAVSRVEYNGYGLPTKSWDARGNLTEAVYDENFPHLPRENYAYLSGDKKLVTKTEYDYVLGLPVKVIDANEQAATTTYDHYGRVLTLSQPLDSADSPSKTYRYFDPLPHVQVATKIFEKGEVSENSRYAKSRQIFNGLGQTIQAQTVNTIVEGQRKDMVTTSEYNSRGQVVKQTQTYETDPHYDDVGWATLPTPEFWPVNFDSQARSETTYDDLGRATNIKTIVPANLALNSETKLFYLGFTSRVHTEIERGKFSMTAEHKDGFGRTNTTATAMCEDYSEQNCPSESRLRTIFKYNLLDQIEKSWTETGQNDTLKKSGEIITRYDRLGRKTGFDDPDLGSGWEFKYDANSNLVWQKDAKGQEIRLEYDGLNRLTKKIYPDKPSYGNWSDKAPQLVRSEIAFEYDAFDPATGQFGRGRQTRMWDMAGNTQIKYDQLGRVTWTEKLINKNVAGTSGAQTSTTQNQYYKAGLVKESVQPDGEKLSYQYNAAGQLIKVSGDKQGDYLASAQYNRFGGVSQQVLGNQTQTITSFDDIGRMTQLAYQQGTNLLAQYKYQFDLLSNIKSWENLAAPNKNLTFQYDPLSRLVAASGPYQAQYQYDAFGRMGLKKEAEEVSINYQGEKPFHAPKKVSIGGKELSYQYDANGNLLDDGGREYLWDYDNKPLAIKDKETGTITYFAYDGTGERVLRKVVVIEEPGVAHLTFKVKLQGISQQRPDKSVGFILKRDGSVVHSETVGVSSDQNGIYTGRVMNNLTPGTYDIFIKGWAHLQKKFTGITLAEGENTKDWSNIELLTGNANGDGKINILDFGIFRGNYLQGTSIADFNLDGQTNIQDFRFIVENYGKTGEE